MKALLDAQLIDVNYPILINDLIGGDGTEVYVEFKGRGIRFKLDKNAFLPINIVERVIDNEKN